MNRNKKSTYPVLRREFKSISELAKALNHGYSYASARISGVVDFSHNDKVMIARFLGKDERLCDEICRKE